MNNKDLRDFNAEHAEILLYKLCGLCDLRVENWFFRVLSAPRSIGKPPRKSIRKEFACHLLLLYNAHYKGEGKHDVFLHT